MGAPLRAVAVIPARHASTRFPGKPLALIAGKPMIQRVYERVLQAKRVDRVIVATDDERIRACVQAFGGQAMMTAADHPTGTDRIAEAVREIDADLVLNVQGDEPLIPPSVLDDLLAHMQAHPELPMGTVAVPIDPDGPDFADPNVVKVVLDREQRALYFSRSPIPYARGERGAGAQPLHHWGVYAYRRDFLYAFIGWPQGTLEECEKLEQLRALEHGARIFVHISHEHPVGVDVPADVARVEALLKEMEG